MSHATSNRSLLQESGIADAAPQQCNNNNNNIFYLYTVSFKANIAYVAV